MRILHVAYSCIPGEYRGGIAKIVFELSKAQAKLGHEVSIYATNYNSSQIVDVPLNQPQRIDGVEITYFATSMPRYFISKSMQEAIKKNASSFDALHGHNTFLALNRYISEASKSSVTPCFYHIHGALDPLVVNKGIIRRIRKVAYIYTLEKQNYRQAQRLFANTENERSQLQNWGIQTPISIVPNGINLPDLSEQHTPDIEPVENSATNKIKILFIGRIVPKKGLHLLLEAIGRLEPHILKNICVMIAGDREQEPAYTKMLDDLIKENQLDSYVNWLGFLDENDKRKVLEDADIFSHVSQSEGMAMSVLEAMTYGLPVLVSKECYMTAAASQGAIIECEFSASDIRQKIELLLLNIENRRQIGESAKSYVAKHHDWSVIAKNLIPFYRTVV